MIIASASSYRKCNTRAYSSCFMHAIVAHMRLLFFKIFSDFVYFSQIFKCFAPFCPFLSFFWKIARIPLLSRIGPEYPWCQWKYTSKVLQANVAVLSIFHSFKGLISSGRNFHETITQSSMFIWCLKQLQASVRYFYQIFIFSLNV